MTGKRPRKGPDPDLIARMATLGAVPAPADTEAAEEPAPESEPKPSSATSSAPRKTTSRKAPARQAHSAPAEQPRSVSFTERINLTVTPDQNRSLDLARVDDGIDKTARLRAMIELWQEDERLRKRIDRRARDNRYRR